MDLNFILRSVPPRFRVGETLGTKPRAQAFRLFRVEGFEFQKGTVCASGLPSLATC